MESNGIKDFIVEWNLKYPIDRWWREKHKIAFGSEQHRKSSLIFQRMEFEEDLLFNKALKHKKDKAEPEQYVVGDWLKEQTLSDEEIDRAFDDMVF